MDQGSKSKATIGLFHKLWTATILSAWKEVEIFSTAFDSLATDGSLSSFFKDARQLSIFHDLPCMFGTEIIKSRYILTCRYSFH